MFFSIHLFAVLFPPLKVKKCILLSIVEIFIVEQEGLYLEMQKKQWDDIQ